MEVLILSSSKDQINPYYTSIAKSISNFVAANECNLVFGAASTSMMGICYEEFSKYNRDIYAFTTEKYVKDLENLKNSKNFICKTTFEMKQRMFENSDMIICLPGGLGTYSELYSYIEEKRSNDKNIPIIIYDENGFYNKFLEIIEDQIKEKFIDSSIYNMFDIAHNKEEFIELFLNNKISKKR